MGVSLLVAIILLILVIFKINHQMKSIAKILSQDTKYREQAFRIALKLITILGLCEITGVIQIRHSNLLTVEEYVNITFSALYAFFRSFKGIMLSLVYLFSQRTFGIYSELLSKCAKRIKTNGKVNLTKPNFVKFMKLRFKSIVLYHWMSYHLLPNCLK